MAVENRPASDDPARAAAGAVSSPELRERVRTAEAQRAEVHAILGGLTEAQAHWRPSRRRWSVGEHAEHLAIVNLRYAEAASRAVDRARAAGLTGTGRPRRARIGEWFLRSLEPPPRPRIPTLRSLRPNRERRRAEVLAAFDAAHDGLVRLIVRADGVDLGRATMRSPFLRPLKLTLGQVFRAILAHNRRHVWLMREVMADPAFPRDVAAGSGTGAGGPEGEAARSSGAEGDAAQPGGRRDARDGG